MTSTGVNLTIESGKKTGILLVDDERNVLSALKRSLRKNPWMVFTAASGEEGLELLEREQVQVVISDYRMKGMDGITFLNRVKERWPDVQRVMLTGQANFAAIERAINESEVFRFLNKPWHEPQLIATINECLDHFQLIESNRRYEAELALRNQELLNINLDLEKKVVERTRALIQAEKMAALGRMSGGVAHEINNPLGGILAFVQVLLRDCASSDPQMGEALETIQGCALRCKSIVENLLSFSRKSPKGDHTELDINQVAKNAVTIAQLHPKAREVKVHLDLENGLPPVLGCSSLLEQVVVNLLQNAYHASAPGQEVILRTSCTGADILLEVEDQGVGIPERILPRIFEPFFTTKEAGEGTGLGLFISYGIAREHGGRLTVESQENQGTAFSLRLPAIGRGGCAAAIRKSGKE